MISVQAAIAICRRYIERVGQPFIDSLYFYPTPQQTLLLNRDELREFGLSYSKADALLAVSEFYCQGLSN